MSVSEAFHIGARFASADTLVVTCRDIAVHLTGDIAAARQYHDGKKRILPFTRLSKHFNRDNGQLTYMLYDHVRVLANNAQETHDVRTGMQRTLDQHAAIGILRDICANNDVHMDVQVNNLPGLNINNPPEFWARIIVRTLTPYLPPVQAATPVEATAPAQNTDTNGLRDGLTINAPRFVIAKPQRP